tara:strand:- start:250 stop:831 length:582 start_codon:yes stop_codon:yes gene_type:complete
MKGKLPDIMGSPKNILSSYSIIDTINPNIKINRIFINFINKNRQIQKIKSFTNSNLLINLLYWNLKDYKNNELFINFIINNNLIYTEVENEIYILNLIKDNLISFDHELISLYKLNQCKPEYITILYDIFTICINLYNIFLNKGYSSINYSNIPHKTVNINLKNRTILLDTLKNISNTCKHIILNNSGISLII